jgi:hypothetical protein
VASSFPNPCQGMVLWDSNPSFFQFTPTGPSPSLASLFRLLRLSWLEERLDPQPHIPPKFPWKVRFGLFPFRSPLLRESRYWFLFLPLLRCFSSGGSYSLSGSATDRLSSLQQEVSFRYPRIYACMRLPVAYRSLPRPSSALKPSHPPDGVTCRAYSVIPSMSVWRLGGLMHGFTVMSCITFPFIIYNIIDDCICKDEVYCIEFDLKGAFALLSVIFVLNKCGVCGF